MEEFLRLNDNDLENIGVTTVGARKKILETIKEIHKQEWKSSSLPNLTQQSNITCVNSIYFFTYIE